MVSAALPSRFRFSFVTPTLAPEFSARDRQALQPTRGDSDTPTDHEKTNKPDHDTGPVCPRCLANHSAPGRNRTCDLEIRRLLLYPAELRGRGIGSPAREPRNDSDPGRRGRSDPRQQYAARGPLRSADRIGSQGCRPRETAHDGGRDWLRRHSHPRGGNALPGVAERPYVPGGSCDGFSRPVR